jgi:DNA-binding transcriptional MerR regulator
MVPPPKLYRIAEIVHHTGLSRQTIHNYTTFGLIGEADRLDGCNYRLYSEEVFQRLARIRELRDQGKSLRMIREVLQEEAARGAAREVESP